MSQQANNWLDNFDRDLLKYLTPDELAEVDRLILNDPLPWHPLPGPQYEAFYSEATVVGYGGAAGGGKTDLACGLAVTGHQKVGIFRDTGTELTAIVDRLAELLGGRIGYNGQEKIWRVKQPTDPTQMLQIELGSYPNLGDEKKWQGRPHDLLIYDEAANHREAQVRYVMTWLRTIDPAQRCRVLMAFNPPTSVEGRWIVDYFAPWIKKKYPGKKAKFGELRWFASLDGKDVEVDGPDEFEHNGELVRPLSRTFIQSKVTDNPFLMRTNYMSTLQALPEPLRSQMLHGDFEAGLEDDMWQVIPTDWVEAAMDRWKPKDKKPEMESLGVDVARGGRDQTIISRRHGSWYDELLVYPGSSTPDGPTVAGLVVAANRDTAPIHIDVIGIGSSPYDFLKEANQQVIGVNFSEKDARTDKSGRLGFRNVRSADWWGMRDDLDPASNKAIALPPDEGLLTELCSATWKLVGSMIQVASRDEIMEKTGHSPDKATAVILARHDTPKLSHLEELMGTDDALDNYDPLSGV